MDMIEIPNGFKLTATGTNGNTYWLAQQSEAEKGGGLCQGCAFSSKTCEDDMGNDSCADYAYAVWKVSQQ